VRFLKAGAALMNAYHQIQSITPPAVDSAKITKWLKYVKTEENKAQQIVVFRHCELNPAKFTCSDPDANGSCSAHGRNIQDPPHGTTH
jgi:hypothetical protein